MPQPGAATPGPLSDRPAELHIPRLKLPTLNAAPLPSPRPFRLKKLPPLPETARVCPPEINSPVLRVIRLDRKPALTPVAQLPAGGPEVPQENIFEVPQTLASKPRIRLPLLKE